ncbi:hypothetical protein [Apilactobacillus micheneri]|nr:hypothetical protein [Apilactobacillus micheneri]
MKKYIEISDDSLVNISGGFNRTAYNAGRYTRKAFNVFAEGWELYKSL